MFGVFSFFYTFFTDIEFYISSIGDDEDVREWGEGADPSLDINIVVQLLLPTYESDLASSTSKNNGTQEPP